MPPPRTAEDPPTAGRTRRRSRRRRSPSAATSGVTMSPVGSTLVSMRITTSPRARRSPMFQAAAQPEPRARPDDLDLDPARLVRAPRLAGVRPAAASGASATTITCVPAGAVARSAAEGAVQVVGLVRRHEHDRGRARRGLAEPARDRVAAAVADAQLVLEIGRVRRFKAEVRAAVDDPPAGRLDLVAKPVRGRPVASRSRRRAGVRGVEDGLRNVRAGHRSGARYGARRSMSPTNSGRRGWSEELADRQDLARVEPVVVGDPKERVADHPRRRQGGRHPCRLVEGVQVRVRRRGDARPGLEHRPERRRRRRAPARGHLVEDRLRGIARQPREPVALLVPGHVGDDPADRVHRLEAPGPVGLGHTAEPAAPLGASEPELLDERVGHGFSSYSGSTSIAVGATAVRPKPAERVQILGRAPPGAAAWRLRRDAPSA